VLLRLRTAVAGVCSAGSSAAEPCLGGQFSQRGILTSRLGMESHWDFHWGTHRSRDSSAAVAAVAAAAAVVAGTAAAIALGLELESAVVQGAAHIAVAQAEARNVVVG
jgi:hypothetical protein